MIALLENTLSFQPAQCSKLILSAKDQGAKNDELKITRTGYCWSYEGRYKKDNGDLFRIQNSRKTCILIFYGQVWHLSRYGRVKCMRLNKAAHYQRPSSNSD